MCLGINGFTNRAPSADLGRKRWGGAYMAEFAMCASRGCRFRGSHTSQKARDVCATRRPVGTSARQRVESEAGMCPGIKGFTNCAPIADWGRKPLGGGIHGGVCHVCVAGLPVLLFVSSWRGGRYGHCPTACSC